MSFEGRRKTTYLVHKFGKLRGGKSLSHFMKLRVVIILWISKLSSLEYRSFNLDDDFVCRVGGRSTRDDSSSETGAAVLSNGKRNVCQALKKRRLSDRLCANDYQLVDPLASIRVVWSLTLT